MRTETAKYEFAHGRKPRGCGNWGFEVVLTDGFGRYTTETVWVCDRFVAAKATACRRATAAVGGGVKVVSVEVLP